MELRREQLVIRVDALVELDQARDIIRRLRLAPQAAEVIIEFAPCAQCGVVPLSHVAEAVGRSGTRVSVRGLSRQDIRILRYLGVSLPFGDDCEPTDST